MNTQETREQNAKEGRKIAEMVKLAMGGLRALRTLDAVSHSLNVAQKAHDNLTNLGNAIDLSEAQASVPLLRSVIDQMGASLKERHYENMAGDVISACQQALCAIDELVKSRDAADQKTGDATPAE